MKSNLSRPRVFPIILALVGLVLVIGGAKLLALGGSWWYASTGVVLIGSAVLLWRGSRWGSRLYGFMLLYTLAWSIWEVGLNIWAWVPRMLAPAVAGLWLLTPFIQRGLDSGPPRLFAGFRPFHAKVGPLVWAMAAFTGAMAVAVALRHENAAIPQNAAMPGTYGDLQPREWRDWPSYSGDTAGTHYSELAQITPGNVAQLRLAWSFRTGDVAAPGQDYNDEATPLKIGGLLYVCTPSGLVFALDAETGKQKWRFDPKSDLRGVAHLVCRGVSYYSTGGESGGCVSRIYVPTPDAKVWSVDALTGQPCTQFGAGGAIDLQSGLGAVPKGMYTVTSPPVVTRGMLVLGAQILDNISIDMPSGVVRAFDAVTGRLVWAWDMGRTGGNGEPRAGESYTRSTPNAWAPLSADEALGLVYIPTGNPSPDFWGKNRRAFDEQYGSSIVALDVESGAVRWSFQTVHHDLWDNDLPAQPALVDIPTVRGLEPAVIEGTKQGEIFILDRRTGVPIVPVTEKRAPGPSNIGERLAATQPASALAVRPIPSPLTEAMMWGATPIDQMWCRIQYREARYEGPYTPPDDERTVLEYPAMFGGIEWGGVSVDLGRKVLVTNPNAMPFLVRMVKVGGHGSIHGKTPSARDIEMLREGLHEIQGTGYALSYRPFLGPLRIPCTEPPWGELYAIDLRTGQILWQRPVGTARDSGPLGLRSGIPLLIGTPQVGGTIVTRSGLIFMGATADDYLRGYDLQTGKELWRSRLPAGGQATPMTYESAGRQFVAIVAGGHGILGTRTGDYVLAYALARPPPATAGAAP